MAIFGKLPGPHLNAMLVDDRPVIEDADGDRQQVGAHRQRLVEVVVHPLLVERLRLALQTIRSSNKRIRSIRSSNQEQTIGIFERLI